jgi:hypothetical protein
MRIVNVGCKAGGVGKLKAGGKAGGVGKLQIASGECHLLHAPVPCTAFIKNQVHGV